MIVTTDQNPITTNVDPMTTIPSYSQCLRPRVSRAKDLESPGLRKIRITGLPAISDPLSALSSGHIINMLHRIKHLYGDGDLYGAKAYRRKLRWGLPVQNPCLRFCFAFTTVYRHRRGENTAELLIDLIWSTARRSFHTNDGRLQYITADEAGEILDLVTQQCISELNCLFDDIYRDATNRGDTPNYY